MESQLFEYFYTLCNYLTIFTLKLIKFTNNVAWLEELGAKESHVSNSSKLKILIKFFENFQTFVYFEKTKHDFLVFSALVVDACTQLSF